MPTDVTDRPGRADESEERIPSVLWPAMRRFAAFALAAAALLTLASFGLAERIAQQHALAEAERQGIGLATRIAAPLVNDDIRDGVPGAADELETVMGNRMQDGSVSHIKLWSADGTVLWADEKQIVGRSFELTPEVQRLFGTTDAKAELTDLSREENVAERQEGRQLLEVYVGTFDADGVPLVFEAYLDTAPMESTAHSIVRSFVPLLGGALVIFLLIMLPLAVKLSRRVERSQRDRARLMRHAVLASDLERRRISRDLHDGVVQELAGVGYGLPIVGRELHPGGDLGVARSTLDHLTCLVQRNVVALRHFMTDIYPPDLEGDGLRDALHQLVRSEALSAGLDCEVRVDRDVVLPVAPARLAHRVVREALRNVVKHAAASRVEVEVVVDDERVRVEVVDDGRGCEAGPVPLDATPGHLGLRLLADTVHDVGGTFQVASPGPGRGVRLLATFPREFRVP